MAETDHVLSLVSEALDEFERVSLSASSRRALRIAQLRGDASDAWLFRADLRPHGGSQEVRTEEVMAFFRDRPYEQILAEDKALREVWIAERQPQIHELLLDTGMAADSVLAGSITDLETSLARFERQAQEAADGPMQRLTMEFRADCNVEVLERIRFRTHAYLCRVEAQTRFTGAMERIFEEHRARVDAHLKTIAPEILNQFSAAYSRVQEGDVEARSHALTSCRRILKAVADVVYPARSEPVLDGEGRSRDVTEDKFVNRLWQFVSEAVGGKRLRMSMHSTLTDVGRRIDALNELSSKGVHAEVTASEVEWCVMQTYLFAGEVLAIRGWSDHADLVDVRVAGAASDFGATGLLFGAGEQGRRNYYV